LLGEATAEGDLIVEDRLLTQRPVALPLDLLLGNPPKVACSDQRVIATQQSIDVSAIDLDEAIRRVLKMPCVADKSFLITIGDRSVGGLVARDQMVGPWQIPVADVAVTSSDFWGVTGEAMAMGERSPLAIINPAASARIAIGEALTNIAAASILDLSTVNCSLNWMAAADVPGQGAALYDAVQAASDFCQQLGIAVPVGKDSMSMSTVWEEGGEPQKVVSPVSLIATAFSVVADVRHTVTPQLRTDKGETALLFIDLAQGQQRLGGSVLAQCFNQLKGICPDVERPQDLKHYVEAIGQLCHQHLLLAYHDRSDGGLFACLCEMAFAGHCGVHCEIQGEPLAALFNEELGAVVQILTSDLDKVFAIFEHYDLHDDVHDIGSVTEGDQLMITNNNQTIVEASRVALQQMWSETSYHMQALRDHKDCAQEAYARIGENNDPGLNVALTFNVDEDITAPFINTGDSFQAPL